MATFDIIPIGKDTHWPRWVVLSQNKYWTGITWGQRSEAALYADPHVAIQDANQHAREAPDDDERDE